MKKRLVAVLKKFLPALIVIALLPVVIALLFLPDSFLYIPPEGLTSIWWGSIVTVLFIAVVFAVIRIRSQNTDPFAQRWSLLLMAPIPIGFGLFFVYGDPLFLLAGISITFFIAAWINYLRFPVRFWQIVQFVRRGNTPKALQMLSAWLQTHPGDWKAFQLRAELHLNHLQLVEAERDARMVLKLRPERHHEDYFQLSQILHFQARYAEAKQAILTALKIKDASSSYLSLGIECYRLEQFEEAIVALEKAIRSTLPLTMGNLMANYYLGRSFEMIGNREQANKYYGNMRKYSQGLKQHIQQINQLPEYTEVIKLRTEYADIEKRLTGVG